MQANSGGERVALITTPVSVVPAGAFLRSARMLPYIVRLAEAYGKEVAPLIPLYSLLSAHRLLVGGGSEPGRAAKMLVKDIVSTLSVTGSLITEPAKCAMNLFLDLVERNVREKRGIVDRITGFGPLYVKRVRELEARAVECIKSFLQKNGAGVSIVYSSHENLEHIVTMLNTLRFLRHRRVKTGVMLQLPPYRCVRPGRRVWGSLFSPSMLSSIQLNNSIRSLYRELIVGNGLSLLQAVSPAPLIESCDLVSMAKSMGVKVRVPIPSIALDERILRYRRVDGKPPVAVYFGRISREKGLLDLLYAWKYIEKKNPAAELWVIGSFNSVRDREVFHVFARKLGLSRIKYLGFIRDRESLYRRVAAAKVLIYPSYQDAYSLVVLEAVALGLLVVAYDIPAVRYVYHGLPSVRVVRRGAVEELAAEASKLLSAPLQEYIRRTSSADVERFIEAHLSWRRVVEAEFAELFSL